MTNEERIDGGGVGAALAQEPRHLNAVLTKGIERGLEMVDVATLIPHPRNVRHGDIGSVMVSIRENGFFAPCAAQMSTRYVCIGNHRLRAAIALGMTHVPVVWLEVDDETALRIMLADNRTSDLATNDEADLAALLRELYESERGLAGTLYDGDDLDELLALLNEEPLRWGGTNPDDVPEPPTTISKPGDIWLLGPHRLMCGDATNLADVLLLMDGERADTLWTDPPYGVGYEGKTKDALTIENDDADDLPALLLKVFSAADQVLIEGAAFYIAHPAGPLSVEFYKAATAVGWRIHETLVWVKDSMVLGRSDYHYRHEPLLYGYTSGGGRRGRGGVGWYGSNAETSVFEIPRPKRSDQHPTMKPVELVARCLRNSAPPGGVVLDPFGGSGSTLIACHMTGQSARLLEIDPHYADVICRRFQSFMSILPVRADTGEAVGFDT